MTKENKTALIAELGELLGQYSHFYITDISGLDAEKTSALRRECFKSEVKLVMVKNALMRKACEAKGINEELFAALKGNSALMLCNTGNAPAKLIQTLTKGEKDKAAARPQLKAAYVEETIYMGGQNLDFLAHIKSKNELIAELVALLQSPAKNVISGLQNSGNTIHGVLKTLGERPE